MTRKKPKHKHKRGRIDDRMLVCLHELLSGPLIDMRYFKHEGGWDSGELGYLTPNIHAAAQELARLAGRSVDPEALRRRLARKYPGWAPDDDDRIDEMRLKHCFEIVRQWKTRKSEHNE